MHSFTAHRSWPNFPQGFHGAAARHVNPEIPDVHALKRDSFQLPQPNLMLTLGNRPGTVALSTPYGIIRLQGTTIEGFALAASSKMRGRPWGTTRS